VHRTPSLNPCRPRPCLSTFKCSGRKRAALIYCVTYTLGCLTKHVNNFWVLCGGRVLCGIATSLLFSAFESWLVSEHFKVGLGCFISSAHWWFRLRAHAARILLLLPDW